MLDGTVRVKRRNHALILRWVCFSLSSSPSDYFREHEMLFFPWRSEDTELISNDNKSMLRNNFEIIKRHKEQYDVFDDVELERVLQDLQNVDREKNGPLPEGPASQYVDEEFRALAVPDGCQNVNVLQDENDLNGELPLIRLPPMVSDDNLCSLTRSLNFKQRQYYAHVLYNVSAKKTFYEYVGGVAGVGKSRLIYTIFQSIIWRANKLPGAISSSCQF